MDKLKPCPFCGSEAAEPTFIGNDHTKTRKVTIRCKAFGCTKGVTVGAMRFSHEWCYQEAVKKWNARTESPELTAANARIAELERALEPLSDTVNAFADFQGDESETLVMLKAGDARRAAALLEKK